MKRYLLIAGMLVIHLHVSGQFQLLSDHYQVNPLAYNPAYSGAEDALSVAASYRQQWIGFKDAPVTRMIAVHSPVYYNKIGLGLVLENSSAGIYNEINLRGSYAYRLETRDGILAMGMGFGLTVDHADWNALQLTDPGDGKLLDNLANFFYPSFSLGMYYYSKNFFVGISLPALISTEYSDSKGGFSIKANPLSGKYFITAGKRFEISDQFNLLPTVLVKYLPKGDLQLDFNAMAEYRDIVGLGFGYRSDRILVGSLKVQVNQQISVHYSFDFDLGSTGSYLGGSHELLLKYVFLYSRNVTGPRKR